MFRLVNVAGRAALEHDAGWYDLAGLAGDDALADPLVAVERHRELHALQALCTSRTEDGPLTEVAPGPPLPRPRQVFGIGLNYGAHAAETGMERPDAPLTFTKFPSCISAPGAAIPLSGDAVDWEVELVAVVGSTTRHVSETDAWVHVAGLTLGQDVSDRILQSAGDRPQFNLAKSFEGYGPIGPALVSVDSFSDPDDIGLWCEVSGERMQEARTSDLIFGVPALIAYLSSICTLWPGDLIFTGTPSGVGAARGRFLRPGDVVESHAEVIGGFSNTCVEGPGPAAGRRDAG